MWIIHTANEPQFCLTPVQLSPALRQFAQYDNTSEGKHIFKVAGIQCWEDTRFAAKFQSFDW